MFFKLTGTTALEPIETITTDIVDQRLSEAANNSRHNAKVPGEPPTLSQTSTQVPSRQPSPIAELPSNPEGRGSQAAGQDGSGETTGAGEERRNAADRAIFFARRIRWSFDGAFHLKPKRDMK